jgi:hypothetical protein
MKNSQLNFIAIAATEAENRFGKTRTCMEQSCPACVQLSTQPGGFHEISYFGIFSGALRLGVSRFRRRYRRSEQFVTLAPR